jgi:hypothetical protein
MKTNYILSTLFLFGFVLFTSCEKEVELDLPPYTSKIVLLGEFNNFENMSVSVGRSMPVLTPVDTTGFILDNVTIKFFEGNVLMGNGTFFNGQYVFNWQPETGKTYTIEASHPDYTSVKASVKMPNQVSFSSSYKDSIGIDAEGLKIGEITFNINDVRAEKNYYQLLIRYYNASINEWFPFDFTSNDIVFLNNEKYDDGSYLFSDKTFNGTLKSIKLNVPFGLALGSPKFEISIKSIDEVYYEYIQKSNTDDQNINQAFLNPVILNSNVQNGLGYVAGVSIRKDTIR